MTIDINMRISLRKVSWEITNVDEQKHRMSKEIAQELLKHHGDGAYLYCVERLSNNTDNPKLWRDVLAWLDEIKTETKGESKCKD